MASAQENAATIRRGYELLNGGNLEELRQIFAEDVVWHGGGRGRLGGAHTSPCGVTVQACRGGA